MSNLSSNARRNNYFQPTWAEVILTMIVILVTTFLICTL